MCGIAGLLHLDGPPPEQRVLIEMASTLAHRGPDAQGVYVDDRHPIAVGLAHRRLSIIDLSHDADQPLANEDGSIRVVLNGEIYNFQELARELRSCHAFRSRSDTEVIVHGYEEWGDEVISRLDGMFAIAIWDARRRRLLLARDPFGKKPLYYAWNGRRLAFASEVKALIAAGVPAAMDAGRLGEYLAFGYVPTPYTLYQGVRKLPPASRIVADAGGLGEPETYWELRVPRAGEEARVSFDEATDQVRQLLLEAVKKRLVADVPLGVLLSGGVDSSAVAAAMSRLTSAKVQSFVVGFEGDSFFDERPHAERVARHLGCEHHSSVVRPDAVSLVETLLHHHDEPFGDSSALPTFLVAQEARRHVKVILNGDGGDEAFAGYDRFQAALIAQALPAPLRSCLSVLGRLVPEGGSYHGTLRRIRRFTEKAVLPLEQRIFAWSTFFDMPALGRLDPGGLIQTEMVESSYATALQAHPESTLLSRLLYLNLRTYLLDDLLPKMDRMTMAHGLEARSPLLDRALIEYVALLPDGMKRRGSKGKLVLKKAVEAWLPPGILNRPKHGFGLPIGAWFRGELRSMVEDTLLVRPRLGTWLKADGVRQIFAEHLSNRVDRGHQLWTLLTLELWMRKHGFG